MHHRELARRLADIPRWVEVRDLLLAGQGEITGLSTRRGAHEVSFVLSDGESQTVFIVGTPETSALDEAVRAIVRDQADVVAQADLTDRLLTALPAWSSSRLIVHTLTERALMDQVSLAGTGWATLEELRTRALPDELMAELEVGGARSPIAVSRVGEKPVAFCYAGSETETLWDVAIDTLEDYRRQGHAARSAALMTAHMASLGKQPVWQSLENNPASWRLAARLGFTPVDELVMFEAHHP